MENKCEKIEEQESFFDNSISINSIEDKQLIEWLSIFTEEKLLITKEKDERHNLQKYKIRFYTEKHGYYITATVGQYLGCVMINRYKYPGEEHTRTADFPDGEYNQDTWNRIKDKIISFETQKIYGR